MFNIRRLGSLLLLCSLTLGANAVMADAFRCGSSIVSEGMSPKEIEDRCGEPDLVRIREEPIFARLQNGATAQIGVVTTRFWYYDRGPNQYVVRIAIRDSLAEEIDLLDVTSIESLGDE